MLDNVIIVLGFCTEMENLHKRSLCYEEVNWFENYGAILHSGNRMWTMFYIDLFQNCPDELGYQVHQ